MLCKCFFNSLNDRNSKGRSLDAPSLQGTWYLVKKERWKRFFKLMIPKTSLSDELDIGKKINSLEF